MKLRTIRHHIGTALRNLFLNRLMTIASLLTVASCVFIVSVFYLLVVNVNSVFGHLQDQIELMAFVDDDVPDSDILAVFDRIIAIPNVRVADFIDRQEAQTALGAMFSQNSEVAIDDDTFLRAFAVDVYDLQLHEDVVAALEGMMPYPISSVRNEQPLVDTLWNLTRVVQTISMMAIFILGAISFVIIINTIRITVSSRQAEIGIMKYVGATDWFIRWPFIIEGILIGLVGASIPAIICVLGYDTVLAMVTNMPVFDYMHFVPGDRVLFYVVPFALILGSLIGLFGSVVSVRQYLKV